MLKAWAKTQATIALSSGQAELAAVVRVTAEGMGLVSVLKDFGVQETLEVRSDATAAIGMVKREGLGRVRHLAVGDLWVQQRVRQGDLSVSKWPGKENPADMMTKGVCAEDIKKHLETMHFWNAKGRHWLAPESEARASEEES